MNAAVAAPMPAGAGRDVLLGARALTKNYGVLRAVDAASLDLYRGEIVALVGDNGAGKSTFIKMLSGVIVPDSGGIVLHGREVHFATPAQARAAGIETLHQNLALSAHRAARTRGDCRPSSSSHSPTLARCARPSLRSDPIVCVAAARSPPRRGQL